MKIILTESQLMNLILSEGQNRGLLTEEMELTGDTNPSDQDTATDTGNNIEEPSSVQQTQAVTRSKVNLNALLEKLKMLLLNSPYLRVLRSLFSGTYSGGTTKGMLENIINALFGKNRKGSAKQFNGQKYTATKNKIDSIIVHCSANQKGSDIGVSEIDEFHRNKNGWRGVGYNYVIRTDGTVEEGRPVGTVGAHCNDYGDSTLPYNYHSIGICYVGGLDGVKIDRWGKKRGIAADTRTPEQKAAMVNLIKGLINQYPDIKEILGHREAGAKKACPCFNASDEYSYLIPEDRPMTPIRQAALQRTGHMTPEAIANQSQTMNEEQILGEFSPENNTVLRNEYGTWQLVSNDTIATVYNAVASQCNNDVKHTASMFRLNLKDVLSHKIIAMERTFMKNLGVKYGDVVYVEGTGKWDGPWQIQDTMNKKYAGKHKIDFLVPSNVKTGAWTGVKLFLPANEQTKINAKNSMS